MRPFKLTVFWATDSGTGSTLLTIEAMSMGDAKEKAKEIFENNYARSGYTCSGIEGGH